MRPDERLPAVDVIKAAAIVAVVLQHAGPPRWSPHYAEFDQVFRVSWIQFHVPAFVLMAGFLSARHRLGWDELVSRLRRLLVPYLVASTTIQLLGLPDSRGDLARIAFELATASSLGI
jgi:fucose 4-O-acetylase-like acetyltransferase